MKSLVTMVIVAMLACATGVSASGPSLSGTWVLDLSRSVGKPPPLQKVVAVVKHTGDRLELHDTITTSFGEEVIEEVYTIDGKPFAFTPKILANVNGERRNIARGEGTRTATWTPDRRGFDLTEEFMIDGPQGPANLKATRHWRLSEDGKTLTIELTIDQGPPGARGWKYVYAKQ